MQTRVIFLFLYVVVFYSCEKSALVLEEVGEGIVVELQFEGSIPEGSTLRIDELYLYFAANDTSVAVDNLLSYDPFAPKLLLGASAVRVPCSVNFRPGPRGWFPETLPNNLLPYHAALGFNQLVQSLGLKDVHILEGSATTAILGSALRVRKRSGSRMKVYKSRDLPIALKKIE
jgi:hypothetical protein